MIASLTGQVADIDGNICVLNVGGVGYELEVTSGALARLCDPAAGVSSPVPITDTVLIHTHMVVREDAQLLYGFADRNERELFRALIRVNGVGPKLAISVLSALSFGELVQAVAAKDLAALTKISGVGKKTAERLLMELKDKLADLAPLVAAESPTGSEPVVAVAVGAAQSEALAALVGLGYRANEVARVLDSVCADAGAAEASTEELVRQALRYFYKQTEAG